MAYESGTALVGTSDGIKTAARTAPPPVGLEREHSRCATNLSPRALLRGDRSDDGLVVAMLLVRVPRRNVQNHKRTSVKGRNRQRGRACGSLLHRAPVGTHGHVPPMRRAVCGHVSWGAVLFGLHRLAVKDEVSTRAGPSRCVQMDESPERILGCPSPKSCMPSPAADVSRPVDAVADTSPRDSEHLRRRDWPVAHIFGVNSIGIPCLEGPAGRRARASARAAR